MKSTLPWWSGLLAFWSVAWLVTWIVSGLPMSVEWMIMITGPYAVVGFGAFLLRCALDALCALLGTTEQDLRACRKNGVE